MTDTSIDYRNYSSSLSSVTDSTAALAGIEEVLPGPPTAIVQAQQSSGQKARKSNQTTTTPTATPARTGGKESATLPEEDRFSFLFQS